MTVALVIDIPDGTMEQYEQVVARLHPDRRMAPGGVLHVAGRYQGGLRAIDLWESIEHFVRFRDEQLVPEIQALGVAMPDVRVVEIDEEKPGNGEDSALVQFVTMPGLDRQAFDAADREIRPDGEMPAALTFHVNGPYAGGWCVIDGWTSKAARDEFLKSRVLPAFANVELSGEPAVEDLLVEATMREPATVAG